MNFSAAELTGIVGHYLWPLARIGAMVSLAPIFGTRTVPAKIKIILSFAIVVTVAPVIETPTQLRPFSLEGLEILAKEMIIGGMIGFAVAVIFNALGAGGRGGARAGGRGGAAGGGPQEG